MGHADLVLYGDTASGEFPLILAMGREPNDDQDMEHAVGRYDFDEFPYCAFWNTSYGLLASIEGMATRELKQLCRRAHASPLVYADCSPVPIVNAVADKAAIRRAAEAAARRHIEDVFAHSDVIRRVRLIFLSGVDGPDFAVSAQLVRERARALGIRVMEVPFFYGTNAPRIRAALSDADRAFVRSLLEDFRSAVAQPV